MWFFCFRGAMVVFHKNNGNDENVLAHNLIIHLPVTQLGACVQLLVNSNV